MSTARANPVYDTLVIVTASLATEIGLGDDAGHLVPKAVGALRTSLVPGASGWCVGSILPRPRSSCHRRVDTPKPSGKRGYCARGRCPSCRPQREARRWDALRLEPW